MSYLPTEDVRRQVVEIMDRQLALHANDLDGPDTLPRVRRWFRNLWNDRPAAQHLPAGLVLLGERRTRRAEQDTGAYDELDLFVRIYFDPSKDPERAALTAERYGDAILHTSYKESLAKRPKDSTVLPGLFRLEPSVMRYGDDTDFGLFAVEVRMTVKIDQSDTYAE